MTGRSFRRRRRCRRPVQSLVRAWSSNWPRSSSTATAPDERPPLKEYIDRHPDLAAEIREVFPAMAMMENIALADESLVDDPTGEAPPTPASASAPEHLGDLSHPARGRPGRHGRRLRGRAGLAGPARRPQGAASAHRSTTPSSGGGSSARRGPRPSCTTPTSCRSSAWASSDGTPYYVMQFIQGQGLDAVLDELRRLRGHAARRCPDRARGQIDRPSRTANAAMSRRPTSPVRS